MHAAVLTKTGVEIREVAKPVPGDDEILIKVQATTVTRGDVVMNSLPGVMF